MNGIFKGVRPLDCVLAGVMTAAGVFLMYENVMAVLSYGLPHPQSTAMWVMLPILWRRRTIIAAIWITTIASIIHVIMLGWNTRCSVELPLPYAVDRFADRRKEHLTGLTSIVLTQLLMIARGPSIGTIIITIPIIVLFYSRG